jgi:hypothetical protein
MKTDKSNHSIMAEAENLAVIHGAVLNSGGPSRRARLSLSQGADGTAIYYRADGIGLTWAEALGADGVTRRVQGRMHTIGKSQIFPTLMVYLLSFSEDENEYLRISLSGSWGQRAIGFGIASIWEGRLSKSITVTLSTRELARSAAFAVSMASKVNGKQKNREYLVPLTQSSDKEISAAFSAANIEDLFALEVTRAAYFSHFFKRIDALTRQSMAAGLLRQGIGLDNDSLNRFFTYAAYTMDPHSPDSPKSDITAIRENARTANAWFQALSWFSAGAFAAANPLLGAAAGGWGCVLWYEIQRLGK